MNASTEASSLPAVESRRSRWLVLFHHLPPKPDYLRVKVRRKLQRIGAVSLKNTVYVLPAGADTLEDFHWLRREIVDSGGDATLCAGEFLEGVDDAAIERSFRRASAAEYEQVLAHARALGKEPAEHDVVRLRRLLRQTVDRDYFDSPGRDAAERIVSRLEARFSDPAGGDDNAEAAMEIRPGSVWVTRQGIFVDRIASAWLIGRFIDPSARFKFVQPDGYRADEGELRFDMFEGEFTHEGERCTFETLLERFRLDDRALAAIGEIVHDIDLKDERFGREETEGIRTVVQGIALGHRDDEARLSAGRVVFDGLYEHFRRSS